MSRRTRYGKQCRVWRAYWKQQDEQQRRWRCRLSGLLFMCIGFPAGIVVWAAWVYLIAWIAGVFGVALSEIP